MATENNQLATAKNSSHFTRYCRAFEKAVTIVRITDQLPMCEETCTQDGICDNRTCLWSVANAFSAKARAETKTGTNPWEEWMSNFLRADFPFMVDYTETAWDPCSVPIASCKDGNSFTFMADSEGVVKLDCTMPRSLQENCIRCTMASGDLVFASLGIQGYDKDPRGLFQIPEVLKWVRFCESQIPDLAAWISPISIIWFAMTVFSASGRNLSGSEQRFPIEFYREWVKTHIAVASHILKEHNANSELIQRVTNSMWHKSGWALHEGWGAWFRGVPYQMSLAEELWQQHRPLTTMENLDYNQALLERIRKQALSDK